MRRLRILELVLLLLLHSELELCASVNQEGRALLRFREKVELDPYGALRDWGGDGAISPCSWFGVQCNGGRVVALDLKNLNLKGTLSSELGKLIHLKSLILHNNSFFGIIPREIGELQKLEVLDLGHNNFSGPLPFELGNILSLEILVVGGNRFIGSIPPKICKLNTLSKLQIDEDLLSSDKVHVTRKIGNITIRRLLQVDAKDNARSRNSENNSSRVPAPAPSLVPSASPFSAPSKSQAVTPASLSPTPSIFIPPFPSPAPEFSPSPSPSTYEPPSPVLAPNLDRKPPKSDVPSPPLSVSPAPSVGASTKKKHSNHLTIYASVVGGLSFLLALSAVYVIFCHANKAVSVRPWATGLSGQLQKAFVTGVPALKRSELETACEDFSNVIGTLSDCKLYKGTLSSGVEIAVASTVITSAKDWSKQSESQFRKKISMLSKVNHKNFVNLIGYCEEEEPFTRVMVFEYAPNGTLFEHLHIKEAEQLDWAARLRIAMGIAYCLEHLHQLNPPVILRNLDSSSVYLTDDYAAKISDLGFFNDSKEKLLLHGSSGPLDEPSPQPESIVYKFGIILLEMISGRLPFSEEDGDSVLDQWASSYLSGIRPVKDMIDPTLASFREEDICPVAEVILSCINPDPKQRPTMAEVAARLKDITAMPPDGATPKLSPLWWAELEILSSEAN